ncbi:hypothetical protein OQA88_11772 [Cercophora sp. LCS_1]
MRLQALVSMLILLVTCAYALPNVQTQEQMTILPPSSPNHHLPQPTAPLDLRQVPTPAAPPAPGVTPPPAPGAPGEKLEVDGGDGYITGVDPLRRVAGGISR